MITNTKQNWTQGQRVKVGFMQLRVLAALPTPGDGAPDVYFLSSLAGDKVYEFVPHHGLQSVTLDEVTARVKACREHVARVVETNVSRAAQREAVAAKFRELFPGA